MKLFSLNAVNFDILFGKIQAAAIHPRLLMIYQSFTLSDIEWKNLPIGEDRYKWVMIRGQAEGRDCSFDRSLECNHALWF